MHNREREELIGRPALSLPEDEPASPEVEPEVTIYRGTKGGCKRPGTTGADSPDDSGDYDVSVSESFNEPSATITTTTTRQQFTRQRPQDSFGSGSESASVGAAVPCAPAAPAGPMGFSRIVPGGMMTAPVSTMPAATATSSSTTGLFVPKISPARLNFQVAGIGLKKGSGSIASSTAALHTPTANIGGSVYPLNDVVQQQVSGTTTQQNNKGFYTTKMKRPRFPGDPHHLAHRNTVRSRSASRGRSLSRSSRDEDQLSYSGTVSYNTSSKESVIIASGPPNSRCINPFSNSVISTTHTKKDATSSSSSGFARVYAPPPRVTSRRR